MGRCRPKQLALVVPVLFLVATGWLVASVTSECAGLAYPFDILPVGDHAIEYGKSLELFCKLNMSDPSTVGKTADDLTFLGKNENSDIPGAEIELPSTSINETTKRLYISQPKPGNYFYYCRLSLAETNKTCLTNVQVGTKPQLVDNFQCKSLNWDNLTCHWDPKPNFVKTRYQLEITFHGRAARNRQRCPSKMDVDNNTCIFTHSTNPHYRQPHRLFIFYLTGLNSLGKYEEKIDFAHFEHVVPGRPTDVKVINKTSNSAFFSWHVPHPMENFPPGLRYKIEYRSQWDTRDDWQVIQSNTTLKGPSGNFNLTNLKYAHCGYNVRVYLKSFSAKPDFEWSQPGSLTFYTRSTIPDQMPSTAVGAFDVANVGESLEVYVYWTKIPESSENGPNFHYTVKCTKNINELCEKPTEITKSYAKFPIDNKNSYTYEILSENEIGIFPHGSFVHVPVYNSVPQPESFTKVSFENGLYELSWQHVNTTKKLSNYTLFWCEQDESKPVPCNGTMHWRYVKASDSAYNMTVPDTRKFYEFAISANLEDGTSSGMAWGTCVLVHNNVVRKIDNCRISDVKARSAVVTWEFRCTQSSSLRGFQIYYCPVSSHNISLCKGDELSRDVLGSEVRTVVLNNLKPYTTYKLQISVIYGLDQSIGPRYSDKRFTTSEDAPSPPTMLRALNVSNSTVTFTWEPPTEHNGVLRHYLLSCSNRTLLEIKDPHSTNFTGVGFRSYKRYTCSLQACTQRSLCSASSTEVEFKTQIGTPGEMLPPMVFVKQNSANISWEKPEYPAGPLNFYQVEYYYGGEESSVLRVNATGYYKEVSLPECEFSRKEISVSVRAINIVNTTILPGVWSKRFRVECGPNELPTKLVIFTWIIGICVFCLTACAVWFLIRRCLAKLRDMKNFEVKLPPGLQSQELKKEPEDYLNLETYPTTRIIEADYAVSSPDAEYLLDKKSDESVDIGAPHKTSGNSSGCSVGRESPSSSITSETRISSDSGAEADQGTSGNYEKRSASERLSKSSSRKSPKVGKGSNSNNTPELLRHSRGPYCGSSNSSLPSSGYVTIASVTSLKSDTPTQVMTLLPAGEGKQLMAEKMVKPSTSPRHQYIAFSRMQDMSSEATTSKDTKAQKMPPEETKSNESSDNETEPKPMLAVQLESDFSGMPPYVTIQNLESRKSVRDASNEAPLSSSSYVPHHVFKMK